MKLVAPAPVVVTSVHGPVAVGPRETVKPVSLFELSFQRAMMLVRVTPPDRTFDGAAGSRPGVVAVSYTHLTLPTIYSV